MKKFNSNYNGLLPLYLDDIRFIQEAYDEQIEALIKPYLPFTDYDSFILSGCDTDPETYAPGWVVIAGKIYRVPGGSVPTADYDTEVVWEVSSVDLSGGAKTPKRLETTVQTWQEETASLVLGIIGAPGNIPAALPRLEDIIAGITTADTGWNVITPASGWSQSNGLFAPKYRVKSGIVYLRGHLVPEVGAPAVICTLPVAARPGLAYLHADGSSFGGFDYAIYPNGNIEAAATDDYIVLDGVAMFK